MKAAEKLGLPMALEGFPDRRYDDAGNLAARTIPGTVLKDPKLAAEQAIRMVRDGEIVAVGGKRIKVKVHTLCVPRATSRRALSSPAASARRWRRPTSPWSR